MFSTFSASCFAGETGVDARTQKTFPDNVEILSRTRVAFKPDAPLKQPLAPLDLFPLVFRQYLPWTVFFNYDIDFQRLVSALHTVAQKYLLLCGRLMTDKKGRYAIEVGTSKGRQYDFPVVEIQAKMQMAEAILCHGKITTNSAQLPANTDKLPFYLEPLDIDAIHTGQDPFLSVKLTHFSDGCCLAITMSHILVDGMRFSELYRDISRAYCEADVPMRDINRQYMTLEGFSKHFCPEDKEDYVIPETMIAGREQISSNQNLHESRSLEILHLSKAVVDEMKSKVAPFIRKGSFVSTADLMQALLWMLGCEMNDDGRGEITNSTELGIAGTSSMYVAELSCNGHGIIPKNYLGNAAIDPVIFAGDDFQSKSMVEVLASLASLTRQKQIELKEHPRHVFKYLVERYIESRSVSNSFRSMVSNFCKFAISDTDFGGGPPSLFLSHSALPSTGIVRFISPAFDDGGVLLSLMLTRKQQEQLNKSSVLRKCAPGIKQLFEDFSVTELSRFMRKER